MAATLECPYCRRPCQTRQEVKPGAKMRCPGCREVFRFFIHQNGTVEAVGEKTEPEMPSVARGAPDAAPPPAGPRSARTIFTSPRKHPEASRFRPFEQSRTTIGAFLLTFAAMIGGTGAYLYIKMIGYFNDDAA